MGNQMRVCCGSSGDQVTSSGATSTVFSSVTSNSTLKRECINGLRGKVTPRMSFIEDKFDANIPETKYYELLNITDEPITKYYKLQEVIGEGINCTVRKAHLVYDETAIVAVKVVKIKNIRKQFKHLYSEILALRSSNHPNITKLIDVFKDFENKKVYFVTEFFNGPNLFDFLQTKKKLKEKRVVKIVTQILKAVKYLHSIKICHRDLKLENIMICPKTYEVKLIDFGYSRKFENFELLSHVGTPYYVAPEVIKGSYHKECDLWSVGVITYCLLSGEPPFYAENLAELYNQICKTKRYEASKHGLLVSKNCKDFIASLMTRDVKKRLTASGALAHPWLLKSLSLTHSKSSVKKTDSHLKILKKLIKNKPSDILEQQVRQFLVETLDQKKAQNLKEAFDMLDYSQSGKILISDLVEVLEQSNQGLDLSEFQKMIAKDQKAEISYNEFMARTLSIKNLSNKKVLTLFQYLDCDHSGRITVENIKSLLKRKQPLASRKGSSFASPKMRELRLDSTGFGYETFDEYLGQLSPHSVGSHGWGRGLREQGTFVSKDTVTEIYYLKDDEKKQSIEEDSFFGIKERRESETSTS